MKFILKVLFFIFLAYTPIITLAGEIYLNSQENIKDLKNFSVGVFLDTKGVVINSFDFNISYNTDIFDFVGYKDFNSIKKIWIVPPKAQNGFISLSGVIPGGVEGIYDPDHIGLQPISIVSLLFKPKSDGLGKFEIVNSKVLINDGLGSILSNNTKNSEVIVNIENTENKSMDSTPPKDFIIKFIESSIFSKTPSMIVFETSDENGIEKYQIYDKNRNWIDIVSPFPVKQSIFNKAISIRALDYSGNSRESVVEVPGLPAKDHVIIGLFVFIACYLLFFVVKFKR